MWPGDKVDLDHRDDGAGYLGLSHSSPCRVCGKRCNQSAGGRKGASAAGKDLAAKRCLICGKPFESTLRDGSTGKPVATCGQRACISALRKLRKDRQPDPQPPDTTGRAWLPPLIRAR